VIKATEAGLKQKFKIAKFPAIVVVTNQYDFEGI